MKIYNQLSTKLQEFERLLLLLFLITSCNCQPQTIKPPSLSLNPQQPQRQVLSSHQNTAPSSLDKKIKELENKVILDATATRLKEIYEAIKFLPPRQFYIENGKMIRNNTEKDSWELFDKLLQNYGPNNDLAVQWLIDEQLIDLIQTNPGGKTPLEEALKLFSQPNPPQQTCSILKTLLTAGNQLTPQQASEYLEIVMKKIIADTSLIKESEYEELIQLLKEKKGAIAESRAPDLLEEILHKNSLDQHKKDFLISLLPATYPISPDRATDLLQHTVEQEAGPQIYTQLIKKGADPNTIKIKQGSQEQSLWCYAIQDSHLQLLQALINNPKTDINEIIYPANNHTLAMDDAYHQFEKGPTKKMEKLLQRDDLDINTTPSSAGGTQGFTLLDLVVNNCLTGSPESRRNWIEFLRKMKLHPNYQINEANKEKIKNKIKDLRLGQLKDKKGQYPDLIENIKEIELMLHT